MWRGRQAAESGFAGSRVRGVWCGRMVIKPTQHSSGRKILASVARENRKSVDKDAILIKKLDDPSASLSQQENARIRGQSRREAARRRAGRFNPSTALFRNKPRTGP